MGSCASVIADGFRQINNNTVELKACTKNNIEGIRWSRGFTTGRHVIEFIYPVHVRTRWSRVGLGTRETSLGGKTKDVIGGQGSFAIDLVSNKAYHNNRAVSKLPGIKPLPDWFFMYVDLDEGVIQFGSDSAFYGTAFQNVTVTDGQLFPMATACVTGAVIGIVYRGEGKEVQGPLRKKR
ncbi:hypothetical protein MAR_021559 [Mya arenaria]|uniref:B30.2/SPRY domain-containing protein n=1 Tax=Mya arenaria TaxID=6604 RepID=A0ABY7EB26_MYAAR|nr:hypothetical protein MAR_021559 [Mya arenaria]